MYSSFPDSQCFAWPRSLESPVFGLPANDGSSTVSAINDDLSKLKKNLQNPLRDCLFRFINAREETRNIGQTLTSVIYILKQNSAIPEELPSVKKVLDSFQTFLFDFNPSYGQGDNFYISSLLKEISQRLLLSLADDPKIDCETFQASFDYFAQILSFLTDENKPSTHTWNFTWHILYRTKNDSIFIWLFTNIFHLSEDLAQPIFPRIFEELIIKALQNINIKYSVALHCIKHVINSFQVAPESGEKFLSFLLKLGSKLSSLTKEEAVATLELIYRRGLLNDPSSFINLHRNVCMKFLIVPIDIKTNLIPLNVKHSSPEAIIEHYFGTLRSLQNKTINFLKKKPANLQISLTHQSLCSFNSASKHLEKLWYAAQNKQTALQKSNTRTLEIDGKSMKKVRFVDMPLELLFKADPIRLPIEATFEELAKAIKFQKKILTSEFLSLFSSLYKTTVKLVDPTASKKMPWMDFWLFFKNSIIFYEDLRFLLENNEQLFGAIEKAPPPNKEPTSNSIRTEQRLLKLQIQTMKEDWEPKLVSKSKKELINIFCSFHISRMSGTVTDQTRSALEKRGKCLVQQIGEFELAFKDKDPKYSETNFYQKEVLTSLRCGLDEWQTDLIDDEASLKNMAQKLEPTYGHEIISSLLPLTAVHYF